MASIFNCFLNKFVIQNSLSYDIFETTRWINEENVGSLKHVGVLDLMVIILGSIIYIQAIMGPSTQVRHT